MAPSYNVSSFYGGSVEGALKGRETLGFSLKVVF